MSLPKTAALAVVLACAHVGCGGDGDMGPSGVETQVASRSLAPQESAAATTVVLGSRGGTVDVSADWTIASNNVDVYVTPADCFDHPSAVRAFTCLVTASATGATARPERVSFPAAAGASYKVYVVNHGAEPDTVTVTLTVR